MREKTLLNIQITMSKIYTQVYLAMIYTIIYYITVNSYIQVFTSTKFIIKNSIYTCNLSTYHTAEKFSAQNPAIISNTQFSTRILHHLKHPAVSSMHGLTSKVQKYIDFLFFIQTSSHFLSKLAVLFRQHG